MKHRKIYIYSLIGSLALGLGVSCKDSFLDAPPEGTYAYSSLTTKAGVEGMLINAYAAMHGPAGSWYTTPINWVWGSVVGGDAYKGSEKTDQSDVNPVERFEVLPSNPIVRDKWNSIYNAIARANQVLTTIPAVKDLSASDVTRISAEARFLRGLSHFEAAKVYGNVPYVDEAVTDFRIPNDKSIWANIEADFDFGYKNLPGTMDAIGRANKWAAGAYLAKAYMFEGKYTEAKAVLADIIANGTTSAGVKYDLNAKFNDNFTIANENGKETVFAMQFSVADGSTTNGNYEMTLAYPAPIFTGCCGFYQPSQSLVNSYRTDASGLPYVDNFNNTDVTSDEAFLSANPAFVPYAGTVDPRLDWTVGRRGIPYLDYGNHPGQDWIRKIDFGGPYSPKKNVFSKAERDAGLGTAAGWGWNNNAKNFTLLRFADIILWAAECEVEVGSLSQATTYVNMIRNRAANAAGFVKKADGTTNAANYLISPYPDFASKTAGQKAVRFERKLELAMEGHRFFDLVRWGTDVQEMTAFLQFDGARRVECLGNGATYKATNKYMPIPEYAVNQSSKDGQPTLKQNDGYN